MNLVSVFLDPLAGRKEGQNIVALPAPANARPRSAHPLDVEILEALECAGEPMGIWQLLNAVARRANPPSRAETRSIRQQALARINPLVAQGALRRMGRRLLALP